MRHAIIIWIAMMSCAAAFAQQVSVTKTPDFTVNGKGDAAEWRKADWIPLSHRGGNKTYETKVKLLYSDSGIYCLFHNNDNKITSTMSADYSDLWKEDVVEIFFWTDEKVPIYFEYELSPRNYELPILVPNLNGKFLGWRPWQYDGPRLVKHATDVQSDAWIAEFYIPFKLLAPLTNVPPVRGMTWRCNIYRLDHDDGISRWSWQPVRTNFHDFERFGTIRFD